MQSFSLINLRSGKIAGFGQVLPSTDVACSMRGAARLGALQEAHTTAQEHTNFDPRKMSSLLIEGSLRERMLSSASSVYSPHHIAGVLPQLRDAKTFRVLVAQGVCKLSWATKPKTTQPTNFWNQATCHASTADCFMHKNSSDSALQSGHAVLVHTNTRRTGRCDAGKSRSSLHRHMRLCRPATCLWAYARQRDRRPVLRAPKTEVSASAAAARRAPCAANSRASLLGGPSASPDVHRAARGPVGCTTPSQRKGHLALLQSHSSTQALWKLWPHGSSTQLSSWSKPNSSRQMAQEPSLRHRKLPVALLMHGSLLLPKALAATRSRVQQLSMARGAAQDHAQMFRRPPLLTLASIAQRASKAGRMQGQECLPAGW